jgi:hypothetical protein
MIDVSQEVFLVQDEYKTKEQLIRELCDLRQANAELKMKAAQNEERYSQHHLLDEKLAAERKRLFSILDGLPALVYLIAPDYSFRFSNKFFQERFTKPKDQPCYTILRPHISM